MGWLCVDAVLIVVNGHRQACGRLVQHLAYAGRLSAAAWTRSNADREITRFARGDSG